VSDGSHQQQTLLVAKNTNMYNATIQEINRMEENIKVNTGK